MSEKNISVYQLAAALFLSRMFTFLLNIPVYQRPFPMASIVLSELASMLLGAAFLIFAAIFGGRRCPDNVKKIVSAVYIAVFTVFSVLTFCDFYRLFSGIVLENSGIIFFSMTLFAAAVYAAKSKIESVMRTGAVLAVVFAVSFAFIIISSVKKFNLSGFSFSAGGGYMLSAYLGGAEYIMFAVLSKKAKGNLKTASALFILCFAAVSAAAVVLTAGVLGNLAAFQAQPFFLLGAISEISIFTKFKALHSALFAFLAAFKLTLLLLCIDISYESAFFKKTGKKSFGVNAAFYLTTAAVILLSGAACFFNSFYKLLSAAAGNIIVIGALAVILPCVPAAFGKIIKGDRQGGTGV